MRRTLHRFGLILLCNLVLLSFSRPGAAQRSPLRLQLSDPPARAGSQFERLAGEFSLVGDSSGERESAGADSDDSERDADFVPLMDNFSVAELALTGAFTLTASVIGYFGEHVVGFPEESFGPPDRDSLDWEVAININESPDLDDPGFWAYPDLVGNPLLIIGAGLYYGFGTVGTWTSDADWLWDTRHEFFAFAGAIAWTEFFVQTNKFAFGRKRPRIVRACNPPSDPCGEFDIPPARNTEGNRQDILSFPGGHTAASAAAMSFIYLDLSDYLVHDALADSSESVQFWVGRILPLIPTYGFVALSFYERLYNQEHWLSDQVVGTAVGLAAGNAFYLLHFDDTGAPLRGNRDAPDDDEHNVVESSHVRPVVFSEGELGVGWGFSW